MKWFGWCLFVCVACGGSDLGPGRDLATPFDAAAGDVDASVGAADLSTNADVSVAADLAQQPSNGDGGVACIAENGDCSSGGACCGVLVCGATSRCVMPACLPHGADCSFGKCCSNMCDPNTYLCK